MGFGYFQVIIIFGGGREDRLGEGLVFGHAIGELHAAKEAFALAVCPPHGARQIAPNDHLDPNRLGFVNETHVGVEGANEVIGNDVLGFVKPKIGQGVEYRSFVGNGCFDFFIESRDPIRNHDEAGLAVNLEAVAHFAAVEESVLAGLKFVKGHATSCVHEGYNLVQNMALGP